MIMQQGIVKSKTGLNLRLKPNGDKIAVLGYEEEFDIVDEVTFYRVKTRDGKTGYVHGDYVEKIPTPTILPELKPKLKVPDFKPVVYSNEHFLGETINIDQDFVPGMDRLAEFCKQCGVKIWVTSSLRSFDKQVNGAIVEPASFSCHHVGHAIDMNVMHDGVLYNSKKLKRDNYVKLPQSVKDLFDLIRADEELRWGGDFTVDDPVHIDDNLYNMNKPLYMSKLDARIAIANA